VTAGVPRIAVDPMTNDKDAAPVVRTTRQSEIFRDPPGSGNYSSSIGAAQGIELFSGSGRVRRARPVKTVFEPARETPVFAETDVLVVGGGPAGTAAAIAAGRLGADVFDGLPLRWCTPLVRLFGSLQRPLLRAPGRHPVLRWRTICLSAVLWLVLWEPTADGAGSPLRTGAKDQDETRRRRRPA
jgi:hypothetical protein